MADKATAAGETIQTSTATRMFRRKRETENKVVTQEQGAEGQPEIVGSLYISRWWMGNAQLVKVTIEKI